MRQLAELLSRRLEDEAAELDTKSLFALEQDLLTLADAIGSHYFPHGASASRPEKLTGLA